MLRNAMRSLTLHGCPCCCRRTRCARHQQFFKRVFSPEALFEPLPPALRMTLSRNFAFFTRIFTQFVGALSRFAAAAAARARSAACCLADAARLSQTLTSRRRFGRRFPGWRSVSS
jgi:hypothetical protein